MKVCLQAGHIHIDQNIDQTLHSSTGAPGEQEFTQRIVSATALLLQSKNFEVTIVDANANSNAIVTGTDWDLFLAVHYDADIYHTGGGFVDFADPSLDAATVRSQELANAISSEYFKHSEIVEHPERSNANTKFYYMWKTLSAATPCVIIECGVGQDAHDKVLLADTQRIASALARGICAGFKIPYDEPTSPPQITPIGETAPSYSQAEIDRITQERDNALAQQAELQKRLSEVSGTLTAIQAVGIQTVEDIQKERDETHAKIEGYTTQLTQVLARNKELAESLAKKEEEDYTAIEEGIKGIRKAKSLEDDIIEIKKAVGMGAKYDFNQLMKKIFEIKDIATSAIIKAKKESGFNPGVSAPVVDSAATKDNMWQAIGLGSLFALIGYITVMTMSIYVH